MSRESVIKKIEDGKVVAIIRGLAVSEAVNCAKALFEGGISVLEVTFNQSAPDSFQDTAEAISSIKDALGEQITVGAGTVITLGQLMIAKAAGAEFIVSPDTDEDIIKRTVELGMVSLPGAYTPSEAKRAYAAGADFVKLFPCLENSAAYIKAIRAPLSHIKFLAVGGINPSNAAEFFKAGAVGVGVGSSLTNKTYIKEGRFDLITLEAKKLIDNINSAFEVSK